MTVHLIATGGTISSTAGDGVVITQGTDTLALAAEPGDPGPLLDAHL